ncbi:hypothetical protein QE152_g33671 [Popillia japonica]|uniref:Copia protein n=1 Tax=Popillia japonica TaxID=7064 RepID=A0AAW1IWA7_POPJA
MASKYRDDIEQIDKLKTVEDFPLWKFQVDIVFKSYGLYNIVTGNEVLPVGVNDTEKTEFERRDAKAQKIIITTVDKKSLTHILSCNSSREMYAKICSIYERDSEERKCTFLQEFFNYKFNKGNDLATHISNLKNIVHKLKVMKQDIDDGMVISKILSTLPEEYKFFTSAWESTQKGERTLDNLTSRLLLEEMRHTSKENEDAVAFRTVKGKSEEIRCRKCNKKNKCEEEVEEESKGNATVFEKFGDDKENTDKGNSEDKDLTHPRHDQNNEKELNSQDKFPGHKLTEGIKLTSIQ